MLTQIFVAIMVSLGLNELTGPLGTNIENLIKIQMVFVKEFQLENAVYKMNFVSNQIC